MRCSVPTLALQPLDFVDAAEDGLDTLIERCDVSILWQALLHRSEIEVGMPMRNLDEHPGDGPWQRIWDSSAREAAQLEWSRFKAPMTLSKYMVRLALGLRFTSRAYPMPGTPMMAN